MYLCIDAGPHASYISVEKPTIPFGITLINFLATMNHRRLYKLVRHFPKIESEQRRGHMIQSEHEQSVTMTRTFEILEPHLRIPIDTTSNDRHRVHLDLGTYRRYETHMLFYLRCVEKVASPCRDGR